MDRSFNFFKTKLKKQNAGPRNTSKSNSSKASYTKVNEKQKGPSLKPAVLTKKQKQIREAIEYRYDKSKIAGFRFVRINQFFQRSRKNSHSSQMTQFKHLKNKNIFDLKHYHQKIETPHSSAHSSQQRKKFNLRFKVRDSTSGILRTQGNETSDKSPYIVNLVKNITPSKFTKKGDEWKFISIQLKEDISKPKTRKTQVKISSHRSYNVNPTKEKQKSNSAIGKYLEKVPKFKELSKLNKNKF